MTRIFALALARWNTHPGVLQFRAWLLESTHSPRPSPATCKLAPQTRISSGSWGPRQRTASLDRAVTIKEEMATHVGESDHVLVKLAMTREI